MTYQGTDHHLYEIGFDNRNQGTIKAPASTVGNLKPNMFSMKVWVHMTCAFTHTTYHHPFQSIMCSPPGQR